MKVQCPGCSKQVPAANLNLDSGWGKCEGCQELFPISDVVPGFSAPGQAAPAARPFNARAITERTADALLIHTPAEGVRAGTGCLLGFATFWLSFVAFWTAGALGAFAGQPPGVADWLFAAFSIPFWLVGIGLLVGVAWNVWGTKSVRIDREGMRTHQRCLVWSRSRWVEFEQLQHARPYAPSVKNSDGPPPRGVEIVYRAGSFVIPADSEEEERWLIAEINDYVKSLAV